MKKLRLLLWEDCNRNCPGCCNKDWRLDKLPVCTDFTGYDEILLTGGEPMLYYLNILDIWTEIKKQNSKAKIYMYTADLSNILHTAMVLTILDGITLTLHEQKDISMIKNINKHSSLRYLTAQKSMRLNVFRGIDISSIDTTFWQVKDNIEWIKNCPLPENEVFMRYRT